MRSQNVAQKAKRSLEGGACSGAAKMWGQKRPGDGRPLNVPSSEIRPDISVRELFFLIALQ